MEIARGCKLLESLNLTWCVNVDDAAMFVIAENCTNLTLLSVFGLKGVSDAMLDALAAPGTCGQKLTTLDVHGCPNVSSLDIYLLSLCVHTRVFDAVCVLSIIFSFLFLSLNTLSSGESPGRCSLTPTISKFDLLYASQLKGFFLHTTYRFHIYTFEASIGFSLY